MLLVLYIIKSHYHTHLDIVLHVIQLTSYIFNLCLTFLSFSKMPSYRLTYFNVRARGETARLLFALKGQEFVDRRVEQADWPALKPGMAFILLYNIYLYIIYIIINIYICVFVYFHIHKIWN